MKHLDRANALVPGDWASLRDVIRDIATDIDKLNSSVSSGPVKAPGASVPSRDAAPGQETKK